MEHSESLDKIAPALVAVAAEVKNSPKTAANKFLGNKYTPLDELVSELRPLLAKHGIAALQFVIGDSGKVGVETVLLHDSGQYLSASALIDTATEKGKSAAQVAGSIVTYLRRYGLAGALNVASEDDTDGHADKPADKPAPMPELTQASAAFKAALDHADKKAPPEAIADWRKRGADAYKSGDHLRLQELADELRDITATEPEDIF